MEFDEYLKNEEPLPDRGFTRAVIVRVERHRRWRRFAILIAIAVAAVVALIAPPSSPAAAPSTELVVAALVLMTVCSLVWIETERTA
jgi:Sec-independent protein secretion pathway component TatC